MYPLPQVTSPPSAWHLTKHLNSRTQNHKTQLLRSKHPRSGTNQGSRLSFKTRLYWLCPSSPQTELYPIHDFSPGPPTESKRKLKPFYIDRTKPQIGETTWERKPEVATAVCAYSCWVWHRVATLPQDSRSSCPVPSSATPSGWASESSSPLGSSAGNWLGHLGR